MSSIDPTDFVQAEGEQETLKFQDPKQQAKFELGVCMAVYKWDELNTAVENNWGGPQSADKRDWISGIVLDLFDLKAVDLILIEETLLYALVDEFDTNVDNDSALEIAALIVKIYRDCMVKDYKRVDELYSKYQEKQKKASVKQQIQIVDDPENPGISDDDDDDMDAEEEIPGLVQDVEAVKILKPEPIVDDDGFELVQKKGKRH